MEKLTASTLIIGAGVIGSSVAMHLAKLGESHIVVVDFDLDGNYSSSELNAGGVRALWTQEVNIKASIDSITFFSHVAEEVGFRPCGYTWLVKSGQLSSIENLFALQQSHGRAITMWRQGDVIKHLPFIDQTDDLDGALHCPQDGLVNPNRLKNYYRDEARRHGVRFSDGILIRAFQAPGTLQGNHYDMRANGLDKESLLSSPPDKTPMHRPIEIAAKRIINCSGPWAPHLAQILGTPCYSQPVRRQVSIFQCRGFDFSSMGMVVDTSGVYFHPEGEGLLAGYANANEPPGYNFAYDGEAFFNEHLWPALASRSRLFENLRHTTGWAGLYEVSADSSGIVGQVRDHLFEAHSFSGHGVMQSFAIGRGLAELITMGRYQTIDLSALSGQRFERKQALIEHQVI